jgi:hypothetical protein
VTLEELNGLELEFLFRLGFDMVVAREEYDWYSGHLLQQEAVRRPCSSAPDAEDPGHAEMRAAAAAGPAPGPASPASTAGEDGPEDVGAGAMEADEGGDACGPAELGCKVPSYSNVAEASAAYFPAALPDASSPTLGRCWGAAA